LFAVLFLVMVFFCLFFVFVVVCLVIVLSFSLFSLDFVCFLTCFSHLGTNGIFRVCMFMWNVYGCCLSLFLFFFLFVRVCLSVLMFGLFPIVFCLIILFFSCFPCLSTFRGGSYSPRAPLPFQALWLRELFRLGVGHASRPVAQHPDGAGGDGGQQRRPCGHA
jgi:hypothetical protein